MEQSVEDPEKRSQKLSIQFSKLKEDVEKWIEFLLRVEHEYKKHQVAGTYPPENLAKIRARLDQHWKRVERLVERMDPIDVQQLGEIFDGTFPKFD